MILLILLVFLVFSFAACQPVEEEEGPDYFINDNESNDINKDSTTNKQAIDQVIDSMDVLQGRLDSEEVGEGGYYMAFDFHINTESNSNFVLKLQAHLFTWPYEKENGDI